MFRLTPTHEKVARAFGERTSYGSRMKAGRASSRSSMGNPAERPSAQCPADEWLGVAPAVLERWAESGLTPGRGLAQVRHQRFTGFPLLIERELPVISVEMVG